MEEPFQAVPIIWALASVCTVLLPGTSTAHPLAYLGVLPARSPRPPIGVPGRFNQVPEIRAALIGRGGYRERRRHSHGGSPALLGGDCGNRAGLPSLQSRAQLAPRQGDWATGRPGCSLASAGVSGKSPWRWEPPLTSGTAGTAGVAGSAPD